ncbi:MAG: D-alanyl-D-alanine carboxypeptidase [Nocardiopsaceae bacterium]|nr:D-alanyl-D-alanine carboxypeptidase [Nocardiopsaceae bacterium]
MQTSSRSTTLVVTAVVTASATAGMIIAASLPAEAATMARQAASQRTTASSGVARIVDDPEPVPRNKVGGPQLASHGIVMHYSSGRGPALPSVPASAYVIANADTGDVLAAKDAHGLYPPASTLKVLTAITMLPRLKPYANVVATKRATSVQPNVVGLIAGQRYKVADLFHALLLISANDAAVALVQASGSFDKGMALLNAEAHHLQAYDVVAKQPSGLPAEGQVVSAYDLALIARRALEIPAFMKYDSMRTARFPVKPRKHVLLVNQNSLLTEYPGGIGGKIGWTQKAGATYIGMARRHGVTLIVTILHARPLTEIIAAEKLLNWGFANADRVRPVGVLVPPLSAHPVKTGNGNDGGSGSGNGASTPPGSLPASAKLSHEAAVAAGVAAAACALALGILIWLRHRALVSRRRARLSRQRASLGRRRYG